MSYDCPALSGYSALQTLVLVMDGSGVGRGCTALMIHVVYKGRALPLAWRVRQAPKGHVPDFSVVLFRSDFVLASERYPMKAYKNQWLLHLPSQPALPWGATNQGIPHGA
jgi:hypothetical protein